MFFNQTREMTSTGFIQVYIAQGILFAYFIILGYKVLKRGINRLNLFLSSFYFFVALGLLINFIYVLLSNELTVLILYYTTLYLLFLGTMFLTSFITLLFKSDKIFTSKKQVIIIICYNITLFCMIFIPNGVIINQSTNWNPVYNIYFLIYLIIILSVFSFIPGIYYGLKLYHTIEEQFLKTRWKAFLIGIIGLYIFAYGTLISNTLNIQDFRTIWSLISVILITIFSYLVYYGVAQRLD